MNKLQIAKLAARLVVGSGTTTVSNAIIRNNVEPANLFEKITVGVTSVVIGSMASEATKSHTDQKIDSFAEMWKRAAGTSEFEEPTTEA